mmetsp:Transcript_28872/g.88676  ORF Transcript_28872/g.88676 Transcript_28872/m.88676 type:complete len:204 (-) Transcript_28872:93-704(-)
MAVCSILMRSASAGSSGPLLKSLPAPTGTMVALTPSDSKTPPMMARKRGSCQSLPTMKSTASPLMWSRTQLPMKRALPSESRALGSTMMRLRNAGSRATSSSRMKTPSTLVLETAPPLAMTLASGKAAASASAASMRCAMGGRAFQPLLSLPCTGPQPKTAMTWLPGVSRHVVTSASGITGSSGVGLAQARLASVAMRASTLA